MTDDRFAEMLEACHEHLKRNSTFRLSEDGALTNEVERERLERSVDCLRLIERACGAFGQKAADQVQGGDPSEAAHAATTIGRFEIVRLLGSGSHGIVYLAWDPAARREVALKIPRPDVLFTTALRERFVREGVAAARLTHPNIVSVLEVDPAGPVCFIVSVFCHGQSLAEWLATRRQPVSIPGAVQWLAQLADCVAHAHRFGVLHRDVKPANIIMERQPCPIETGEQTTSEDSEYVELVPKLTDFGLAKLLDSTEPQTRSGVMLGTPAYMAPEQVDPTLAPIGPATDLYGLGAVAFELLTGRRLFSGETDANLLHQVLTGDFPAPRQVRPDVPADLNAILLKCLERRPAARYGSATALADDLRRFLRGEVTHARPLGGMGRLVKWARRRPTLASAVLISCASFALLLMGGAWHSVRLSKALHDTELSRQRVQRSERQLRRLVYAQDLRTAHVALEQQDVRTAANVLGRQLTDSGGQTGFLWRHLWATCHGQPLRIAAHRGRAYTVDIAHSGQWLVSTGSDGLVHVWDSATGKRITTLPKTAGEVSAVAFKPDDSVLASAGDDGQVSLWDTRSWRLLNTRSFPGLRSISCLSWSPDGGLLAVAGGPPFAVLLWQPATDQVSDALAGHTKEINALAFTHDGARLVTGSTDKSVRIYNVDRRSTIAVLKPKQGPITCLAISPNDEWGAAGDASGWVTIWNMRTLVRGPTFNTRAERLDGVVFCQDDLVAIGDQFGVIHLWDWRKQERRRAMYTGQGRTFSLAYCPRTSTLASAGSDGSIQLYALDAPLPARRFDRQGVGQAIAFDADSRQLASSDRNGNATSLDLASGLLTAWGPQPDVPLYRLAFDRSGRRLFGNADRTLVWQRSMEGDGDFTPFIQSKLWISQLTVVANGRLLATADTVRPYNIRLWDSASGEPRGELRGHSETIAQLACSTAGDLLASASVNGSVRIWHVPSQALQKVFTAYHVSAQCVAFSPDGQEVATAGGDLHVRFWDVATGVRKPPELTVSARVMGLAYCPDEDVLVIADEEGTIRFWNRSSGEVLVTLGKLTAPVDCLAFSPDGCWLAAGTNSTVRSHELLIWHAPRR